MGRLFMTHRHIVNCFNEIFGLRIEYIWNELLWISVIQRKPRTLNMDHDPVPSFEPVACVGKPDIVLNYLCRGNRPPLFWAVPVTPSDYLG